MEMHVTVYASLLSHTQGQHNVDIAEKQTGCDSMSVL